MAADSRWGKRFRTNLTIRFGVNGLSDSGVVHDISAFGFFIMTSNLYPDGTLIKIQIMTPERGHISLEGTVQWSVKKRDNVKWLIKDSGMGIKIKRFQAGQEHYEDICQLLCQRKAKKNQPPGETNATGSPAAKSRFLSKLFS